MVLEIETSSSMVFFSLWLKERAMSSSMLVSPERIETEMGDWGLGPHEKEILLGLVAMTH